MDQPSMHPPPGTTEPSIKLGVCLCELARYGEAERILTRCLDDARRPREGRREGSEANRPDEGLYVRALTALAGLYQAQSRYDAAMELREEAVSVARSIARSDDLDLADNIAGYAETLRKSGDLVRAERHHREALAMRRRAVDEGDCPELELAVSYTQLGCTLSGAGRWSEAYEQHRLALTLRYRYLEFSHGLVSESLNYCAESLCSLGRAREGIPLAMHAVQIRRSVFGTSHPAYAHALGVLASCYHAVGRPLDASERLETCLKICEGAFHKDHANMIPNLMNYGEVLRSTGDLAGAVTAYERAEKIHKLNFKDGRRAGQLVKCEAELASLAAEINEQGAEDRQGDALETRVEARPADVDAAAFRQGQGAGLRRDALETSAQAKPSEVAAGARHEGGGGGDAMETEARARPSEIATSADQGACVGEDALETGAEARHDGAATVGGQGVTSAQAKPSKVAAAARHEGDGGGDAMEAEARAGPSEIATSAKQGACGGGDAPDTVTDAVSGQGSSSGGDAAGTNDQDTPCPSIAPAASSADRPPHHALAPMPLIRPEDGAEGTPVVVFTDIGRDADDEMAMVLLSALKRRRLLNPIAVIATLSPQADRARLARGALDSMGMADVPVGVGGRGGVAEGTDLEVYDADHAMSSRSIFQDGIGLARRALESVPDGSARILCLASLSDMATLVRDHRELLMSKVKEVVVMGGVMPLDFGETLVPDTAYNNNCDMPAARYVYQRCQELGMPTATLSRWAAYGCPVRPRLMDELAKTRHTVAVNLRGKSRQGIDGLWNKVIHPPGHPRREKLPARCDVPWFLKTFCGTTDAVPPGPLPLSIWDRVEKLNMYDPLAVLICVPSYREAHFERSVRTVDGVDDIVVGTSMDDTGIRDPVGLYGEYAGLFVEALQTSLQQPEMPLGREKRPDVLIEETTKILSSRSRAA